MVERKAFLLYTGYFEQIEMLTIEQRGVLLTAIMAFQTNNELPEMDAITKMAYSFISADMRRDGEKYEETIEKRREAGRKGGKITQANRANASSACFASNVLDKQNQANQANQADNVYVDVNEDVKEDVDVCVNDNEPPVSGDDRHDTHTPNIPTLNEITIYCARHNISTDVEKFWQYNNGKGWPMDWVAALALWVQKDKEKKQEAPDKNRFNNFKQREYDFEELEKQLLSAQWGAQ